MTLQGIDTKALSITASEGWRTRWWLLTGWTAILLFLFYKPLLSLVRLSLSSADASHLLLIPFLSSGLLFIERRSVFKSISYDAYSGCLFTGIAAVVLSCARIFAASLEPDVQLTFSIFGLTLFWIAGFGFFFGRSAIKGAHFSLAFLTLMIPIPGFILDKVIRLLQDGSADVTGVLFEVLGVPALREGNVFHLARVSIEVAKECSGIRSSLALLILALPIVHFGMRRLWKKAVFLICALFVMILKNGIRIVTLTLLAMYVDPGFLIGRLHREGGIVFFLLGLLLLLPAYCALRVGESTTFPLSAGTESNLQ